MYSQNGIRSPLLISRTQLPPTVWLHPLLKLYLFLSSTRSLSISQNSKLAGENSRCCHLLFLFSPVCAAASNRTPKFYFHHVSDRFCFSSLPPFQYRHSSLLPSLRGAVAVTVCHHHRAAAAEVAPCHRVPAVSPSPSQSAFAARC